MSTRCADTARFICGVINVVSLDLLPTKTLPMNENSIINFIPDDSIDVLEKDAMCAPKSVAACDLALNPTAAHVRTGQPAEFRMASTAPVLLHESILAVLALGTEVTAAIRILGDDASPDSGTVDGEALVEIEVDAKNNCMLLKVIVPPGIPDGALVVIKHVCVAGCDVALSEQSSSITIGFNHTEESEGAAYSAAATGDMPGLLAALDKGESTEQRDGDGRTALMIAVMNGHLDIAHELIKAGASVGAVDLNGFDPLQMAAWNGHVSTVTELVAAGADVNVKDLVNCGTALHLAVWNGHVSIVAELVAAGANLRAKDKSGFTPLGFAKSYGKTEVVTLLEAAELAAASPRR